MLCALLALVGCRDKGQPTRPASPSAVTSAAAAPGATPAPSAEAPARKAFLWQTRSPTATVYLLGSVHVAQKSLYPLDPRIEQAFQVADTVALEIVMDDAEKATAASKLVSAGSYPDGESLSQKLTPTTRQLLARYLERSQVPSIAMERFRPWFAAITITMGELARLGFVPELGIDEHFRARAKGKKQLISIETVDAQVQMFAGFSDELSEKMLRQTLEQLPETAKVMSDALDAWQRGDSERIDSTLLAPMRSEYPKLFERLFTTRNRAMADAVERLLKESGSKLVIVGSGHLAGPASVIEVLRQRGHKLVQL